MALRQSVKRWGGNWYLVVGIWYLVFGIWYLVFGIWL